MYDITNNSNPYGAIPLSFRFRLGPGRTVFIGKNDSGKSTLLQLIFKSLFDRRDLRNKICFIERDRYYIQPTTQPHSTLINYNQDLRNSCVLPKDSSSATGPNQNILPTLLLHQDDFLSQVHKINDYLMRLGFDKIILKDKQNIIIDSTIITKHGSGLRSVLPILAALTSSDMKVIIIDEPELSLEARLQKTLKEFLIEGIENDKNIVIATQSHLFLDRKDEKRNYIVSNNDHNFKVQSLSNRKELLDTTYDLLGNSLQDLFFPNNFLIVEGSSDQIICEKVASLLNITTEDVKIISARGIDNITDSYKAIENTLIPLIVDHSPYSEKVVVMIDKPKDSSFVKQKIDAFKKELDDRCLILDQYTIEEYIPEDIYLKAGRNKNEDLETIKEIKERIKYGGDIVKLFAIKKEISSSIIKILEVKDLNKIPIIKRAVEKAHIK